MYKEVLCTGQVHRCIPSLISERSECIIVRTNDLGSQLTLRRCLLKGRENELFCKGEGRKVLGFEARGIIFH